MERASAAIAAAGGPGDAPRIEGPQGTSAVTVYGASLRLCGVAVAASGNGSSAVHCDSEGRAELAGCTLSSPEGSGLAVDSATAEVQGGSIADCLTGVYCHGSGAKATVRTARPRTAEAPRYMPRPLAAIFTRLPFVFPPVLWLAGTAAKRRLIHPRMAARNVRVRKISKKKRVSARRH